MNPIVRYRNWGDWDQLDDQTIKNGERLRVKFPSGKLVLVEACVIVTSPTISDMGHSCKIEDV